MTEEDALDEFDEAQGSDRCGICDNGGFHGCCDDVCRANFDALDCDHPRPCSCNPRMEIS